VFRSLGKKLFRYKSHIARIGPAKEKMYRDPRINETQVKKKLM
jgi:hypothetical protein